MNDFELEESFLGNLILQPKLNEKVVISDKCFFDNDNKFIFNLLQQQYKDIRTIDLVLLSENYKHLFNEKFEINRIIQKLTRLMVDTLMINKFDSYQEALFARYIKYGILTSIKSYQQKMISTDELLNDIHKFENMSIKLSDNKLNAEQIFKLINSKGKKINLRFKTLSKFSNIQEHDLIVIAARTGVGKSGFALNLLEDLSNSYNCILFNMEMSTNQVYKRLVAINTKVPMKNHSDPETDYQLERVKEGCKNIANKNIQIVNGSQTVNSIRRMIVNETKKGHTIAFIDYVGLIVADKKYSSPYERVTEIVKELRQISLDYDCTIFLISQLNRNAEDKVPKLSELKESGELEQSASTVLLLHNENAEEITSSDKTKMTVIIAKNRNGKVGIIKFTYDKSNQRYEE